MFLALADECYRKCGATQRTAARLALKELRSVQEWSTKHKKRLYGPMGIAWRSVESSIGTSHRSRRIKRKKPLLTPAEQKRAALTGIITTEEFKRNVESVRGLVNRFRRENPNFNQLFESWYANYLSQNPTDEWFQRIEPGLRERFERMKADPEILGSPQVAFTAGGLGRMYAQFGRSADAETLYRFALDFWQTRGEQWPHWQVDGVQHLKRALQDLGVNLHSE
jgi:hypothetical protein